MYEAVNWASVPAQMGEVSKLVFPKLRVTESWNGVG